MKFKFIFLSCWYFLFIHCSALDSKFTFSEFLHLLSLLVSNKIILYEVATGEEKKLGFFLVLYYRHYIIIIIINHNLLQIIAKIQINYIKINYIKRLPSIQLYMQNTKKTPRCSMYGITRNVWNKENIYVTFTKLGRQKLI